LGEKPRGSRWEKRKGSHTVINLVERGYLIGVSRGRGAGTEGKRKRKLRPQTKREKNDGCDFDRNQRLSKKQA